MFQPSKVMQDFLHSMNQPWLLTNFYRDDISWYLLNVIFCWIYQPCLLWILWIPTNHCSKPLLWAGYYYLGMVHNQRPGRSQIGKFFLYEPSNDWGTEIWLSNLRKIMRDHEKCMELPFAPFIKIWVVLIAQVNCFEAPTSKLSQLETDLPWDYAIRFKYIYI